MTGTLALVPAERIERAISVIRGQKALLGADLADLYEVSAKRLNEQVKRNRERFLAEFIFQLTREEADRPRSQLATLELGRGRHRKYPPYAFTEQGVAMLSSVLHSPRAIPANIEIMCAFVRLRQILASHAELARKLATLERKYDAQFKIVFDAARRLMVPPAPKRRKIGFVSSDERIPSHGSATAARRRRVKPGYPPNSAGSLITISCSRQNAGQPTTDSPK
jgi:hypothetical protein